MKAELIGAERGQSVLEILIALAIIILSASSAVAVLFSGRSLLLDAQMEEVALNLSRQDFEISRATAQTNFASLTNSSSTAGDFTRETIVESIDAYTKKVTNRVSWKTNPLRNQKVEFSTIVTDWRNVSQTGGDTGGGGLTGDWKNPRTLGSINIGAAVQGTDLDVINKIIYMTTESSTASKSDFFVIDATNGENPVITATLNTTNGGLTAIDVAGTYAYAANNTDSDDKHLQIIDVSNILSPTVVSEYTLPSTPEKAISIFYANGQIYIGTEKNSGEEFHIVDVANVQNPARIGSFEVDENVNGIYVLNNIVYVASDHSSELKILDVSNPANIIELGNYDAPGNSENGQSVYLVDSKLYLGRTRGGNHTNHHEFHILDVSSSTSPQNLSSKDLAYDLNDLRVRDSLAFLATNNPNEEFQVWNISDPANIAFWNSFNFPQVATGIDYEDNIVYVSVRSNDALRIITSQ